MDFELTEEQAALREVSRGMLAVSCPPSLVRSLATAGKDVDDKLWQYGAELGWTGLAIPEEHDGGARGGLLAPLVPAADLKVDFVAAVGLDLVHDPAADPGGVADVVELAMLAA